MSRVIAMSDWKTIKSAPKDGTHIIGQWPSYDKNHGPHVGPIVWESKWYMLGNKVWEGWWCVGGGLPSKEPTHWQPYPEPLPVDDGQARVRIGAPDENL